MDSAMEIWNRVLQIISADLTATALTTWFEDCTAVDISDNRLFLHMSSDFKRGIVESRFIGTVKDALNEIFSGDFEVVILDDEAFKNYVAASKSKPVIDANEFTFDRFVVGASNRFAHAAAQAVGTGEHRHFNPLFIYGDSGLGKTHLLHAIRHSISQNFPHYNIVYVKGDDFTNELIVALQFGKNIEFREKYRGADVFLIDDVQFIAGKISTQEEFFHTFNSLHEHGRQIVLTSDRPPSEIMRLEDRLKTRFESGLLADIQPPDYELRMAIIRNRAKELGFTLPDDVCVYIAENMSSNIRQLEGAVKKVMAFRDILDDSVTVSAVSKHLKDMFKGPKELIPTIDTIIDETAKFYMISVEELKGQRRTRNTAMARQIAMYLIRKLTNLSLKDIGFLFEGRDHSTVLSSIRRVETNLNESPDFSKIIRDITSNINTATGS